MKNNESTSQPKEGERLSLFVALVAILVIATGAIVILDNSNEIKADETVDDFTYTTSADGATVTGLSPDSHLKETIVIPDTVNINGTDYNVVAIGNNAFTTKGYVFHDLTIGGNVKTIGNVAFGNCAHITGALTIPSSVTSIGAGAFGNCTGIEELTIPSSVTSIGNSAFIGCTKISSIVYNAKNATIGENDIFTNVGKTATNGFTVEFGDSVESIPAGLFYENTYLKSISIGKGVTSIGNSAFKNCSGIGELTIPSGVTNIMTMAFYGCSGIGELTIPDTVANMGEKVFYGCSNISHIEYNAINANTNDKNDLFINVGSSVTGGFTVNFGESVKTIPGYIFYENTNCVR